MPIACSTFFTMQSAECNSSTWFETLNQGMDFLEFKLAIYIKNFVFCKTNCYKKYLMYSEEWLKTRTVTSCPTSPNKCPPRDCTVKPLKIHV